MSLKSFTKACGPQGMALSETVCWRVNVQLHVCYWMTSSEENACVAVGDLHFSSSLWLQAKPAEARCVPPPRCKVISPRIGAEKMTIPGKGRGPSCEIFPYLYGPRTAVEFGA